jgi:hypothetical protein
MFCIPLIAYTVFGTYTITVMGITYFLMAVNSAYGVSFTNNLQQLPELFPIAAKIPLLLVGLIDTL